MSAKFVELFFLAVLMSKSEEEGENHAATGVVFLTPEGVGDEAVVQSLEMLGYLEKNQSDEEKYCVTLQLPGWNTATEEHLLGYSLPSTLRAQYQSVISVRADIEKIPREDIEEGLQAICRMVGYWKSVAYAKLFLDQINVCHSVDFTKDDNRVLDLLKTFSPAETRYLLWLAQRDVAIGLLAGKVAKEKAFDALIDNAVKTSTKYRSGHKKPLCWSWLYRKSISQIEVFLDSVELCEQDFDRTPYRLISLS